MNDNTYYKILGILSHTNKMLSLKTFNATLDTLGLPHINMDKFKQLMLDITIDGIPCQVYEEYSLEDHDLDELLVVKNSFLSDKGDTITLSDKDISRLSNIVDSLCEVRNGNININTVFKKFNSCGFDLPKSMELLNYLLDYSSTKEYHKKDIKSDKQLDTEYALLDTATRYNMKIRSTQNLSRKYNALKRDVLDELLLREQVLKALPKIDLQPLDTVYSPKGNVLLVSLSDVHVGLKTADFDYDVLIYRMQKYLGYIKNTIDTTHATKIILVSLGDIIENVYMHPTQGYEVEFTLSEQIVKALSLYITFIHKLREITELPIECHVIEGNHDRLQGDKKKNLFHDGASTILKYTLEEYTNILGIDFVDDNLTRQLISVNGTNIAITHGDNDKLNDKVISKLSDYFNTNVDIVLGGHLHNLQINERGSNRFIIQSGAMFTGNAYSDSLGVNASASQVMLSIDDDGKAQIIPVVLS